MSTVFLIGTPFLFNSHFCSQQDEEERKKQEEAAAAAEANKKEEGEEEEEEDEDWEDDQVGLPHMAQLLTRVLWSFSLSSLPPSPSPLSLPCLCARAHAHTHTHTHTHVPSRRVMRRDLILGKMQEMGQKRRRRRKRKRLLQKTSSNSSLGQTRALIDSIKCIAMLFVCSLLLLPPYLLLYARVLYY